jgi:hypothetical protein
MISFKNKRYILVFSLFFFLFAFSKAEAATLNIKPSQIEVSVGNIVNVQVSVDTSNKIINNAESVINFPKDLLEVVSLDNKSSIFSLWVENPSFSNNLGQITFNGGVPNPGFQGSNGKIVSIIFRAKKTGTASIVFSNSAVRENDGLGTDILINKNGSTITIVSGLKTTPTTEDSDFVITSPSHPDQNSWYNKSNVDVSWTLPKNATGVKTLLGAYSDSDPIVYYSTPITSKNITDLGDGTWYFHANYLANGVWSKTKHFKLQIDTVDPTDLIVEGIKDNTDKVTLDLKASDSLSGIDHFTVVVNSEKPIIVKSSANGEASIDVPFYKAGEHKIIITAFDKAGNKTKTETTVTTNFESELRIDSYPAKIRVNENIEVYGTTPSPYASIRVSLKNSDNVIEVYKIKSDSYSKFYFKSQPVSSEGEYILWVDMLKENEEINFSSEKVKIIAEEPLLLQIGSYTIGLMKVLIPAAILLIIFLLTMLYGWHKFFSLYRKVKKERIEAEKISSESFEALRKDVSSHITKLKRAASNRKLTEEEIEFLEQLKEELENAESVIDKEIGDITH